MPMFDLTVVPQLLAALGGGLLVGIERERSKGSGPERGSAGVRSFALAALVGAISAMIGTGVLLLSGVAMAALILVSYTRSIRQEPGLTSEVALYLVFLLGALSAQQPQLAAALFVVVAMVLTFKQAMHHFTRQVLTEAELGDLLLLAASVLIILPLLPDRTVDPFDVLNPRKLWLLVVLVMTINAAGYVALRLLGARRGLLLAGLLGGFVSSAATIGSMGQRARQAPDTRDAAVAAGLMSNVATVIQLVVILGALSLDLLREFAPALASAAVATGLVALVSFLHARGEHPRIDQETTAERPFDLGHALLFAAIIAAALLLSAALHAWLGSGGLIIASAAAGLADVHAAAISLGQLTSASSLPAGEAGIALAAAFAANSLVKCIAAFAMGGIAYARPMILGIAVINAALVAGLWLM
ncbi:MAG: DUF4010 domain-containing protein [Dokdonella sp.]